MYQSYWGLREMPFRGRVAPKYFFTSPTHEEALARLHFLVENHRRVGLLLGESGSGKTLLLEVFADQIRRSGRVVAKLNLLGLDSPEMLWQIAVGWGLNPPTTASVPVLWRLLTDRLAEHHYRRVDTVLLLDDADEASPELLPHLARLAQGNVSPDARLTLLLAVEEANVFHLGNRLLELADLRIDLEPWSVSDLEEFLAASLMQAGRKKRIFTEQAVVKLQELSQGIPRRVVQLADLALLAGAGAQLSEIDAEIIESVSQELGAIAV